MDEYLHIGQTCAVHLSGIAHWSQELPLIIEYIKSFHKIYYLSSISYPSHHIY
jgi:hypothetical protein